MPKDRAADHGQGAFARLALPPMTDSSEMLARMMTANSILFENMAQIGDEITGFLGRRLQAEIEMRGELAGARTPVDAAAICMRHCERAMREYGEEGSRMAELVADMTNETLTSVAEAQQSDDSNR